MIELDPKDYHSPGYYIRAASKRFEAEGAQALRHRVFVEEQGIFADHDRDGIDLIATHLVVLSTLAHEADQVVGTVRIHEERPGHWWGSRLAVDSGFRNVGRLGAELIRLAVCTANAVAACASMRMCRCRTWCSSAACAGIHWRRSACTAQPTLRWRRILHIIRPAPIRWRAGITGPAR